MPFHFVFLFCCSISIFILFSISIFHSSSSRSLALALSPCARTIGMALIYSVCVWGESLGTGLYQISTVVSESSFALPFRDGIHIHMSVVQVQVSLSQIYTHSQVRSNHSLCSAHKMQLQIEPSLCPGQLSLCPAQLKLCSAHYYTQK